jgi:DNA-binding NarL/FixJ family response regulator
MSTRILIADDHQIVRDGLRALIERHSDLELVAEAADGRSAVDLVQEHLPDVVVMDVGMSDLNGVEATRQIRSSAPDVKVIALSMHSDRRYVSGMLAAGAAGYLLKDAAFEQLSDAIATVIAGQAYLSPEITGVVVEDYLQRAALGTSSAPKDLSAREREVLQLLAEGLSTKQIASELQVSVKTVETHRQRIMGKLGLRSIAELTKYAVREGLTSLEP